MREPVRSRERDTRSQKEILKEREMEEEEKEVKRAARKAEEKESIYQVRSNYSNNTTDSSFKFSFSPEGEAAVVGGAGEQEGERVHEREPEGEKEGRGD